MPLASSAGPNYRSRGGALCVPSMTTHWSAVEDFEPGFSVDAWAERQISPGEVAELQAAATLLAIPLLMATPMHVEGHSIVGTSGLRVWVTAASGGRFDSAAASLTESNLADMWHALHLAARPEGAHLRSAEQLLSFARIRRAMFDS